MASSPNILSEEFFATPTNVPGTSMHCFGSRGTAVNTTGSMAARRLSPKTFEVTSLTTYYYYLGVHPDTKHCTHWQCNTNSTQIVLNPDWAASGSPRPVSMFFVPPRALYKVPAWYLGCILVHRWPVFHTTFPRRIAIFPYLRVLKSYCMGSFTYGVDIALNRLGVDVADPPQL